MTKPSSPPEIIPPTCRKCDRTFLAIVAALKCARPDCWLDFSPSPKLREVAALVSPEYVAKVGK